MYRLFYVSHVFPPDVAGPSKLAHPDTRLLSKLRATLSRVHP
jgi:hypothetical protein